MSIGVPQVASLHGSQNDGDFRLNDVEAPLVGPHCDLYIAN